MSNKWTADYTTLTPEQADLSAGKLPDGWYRMLIYAVTDDDKDGSKYLAMRINHGPLKGIELSDSANKGQMGLKLWNPDFSEYAEGAAKIMACYASRLGLVGKDARGQVEVDFDKAIGKEVAICLHTSPSKDGKYENQRVADRGYAFFNLGNPKMPQEAYVACGMPAPAHAPKASKASGEGAGGNGESEGGKAKATPGVAASDAVKQAAAAQVWGN